MELNKLEQQIKEKLNSREIQPSEKSWDRLDVMLSIAEEKKTKRSFGWLYIAASILVLLTAGMFFFTEKNIEITPDNAVVDQEITKDSLVTSQPQIKENTVLNEKIQPLVQIDKNTSQPTTNNPQPTTHHKVSIIKSNQVIANQANLKQRQNESIESKSQEVIVESNIQQITEKESINKDISIPFENQKLIVISPTKDKSSTKLVVNPSSLLNQVENELDMTFREKVLHSAKKNFKEIKTAVAERNNL